MITISLDEYGEFEKDDNKPLFIAGLIYDDGDDSDQTQHGKQYEEDLERKRIAAYYRNVMSDAGEGFEYPKDLHSNGDTSRDHNVIAKVKDKVAKTLSGFISDGTYGGQPLCGEDGRIIPERKGCYHIFVMLKSDDGKRQLLSENANMLAKDDWAANRYFHMAGSVVNRIIFHNPLYRQGHANTINIDIATRSTGSLDKMGKELAGEFRKQAYRVNNIENSDYRFYSIMNADIYRTLIAQEMVNSGNIFVKINKLYVRSIQYDAGRQNMEFLYLADSICSLLGYRLKGQSADQWLDQILDRTEMLNKRAENLVFGYDEIDNYFTKAWNSFENGNIYEALALAYDGRVKSSRFAELYRKVWFPYLERRIRESVTPELFSKSVNDLSALLITNNLDQEKLLYLMMQFELMVDVVSDKYRSNDMRSAALYKLYDAGVSAFCHVGDAKKALEYYDKCKQYAFYVGVDEYLSTNNKLLVCLEDSFEWEKAATIAVDNVSNQQLVSEIKREILKPEGEADYLAEAKAVSQLARICAEMRDEKAEKYFRQALEKLEKGSANYKITQSYLLHYYADMGMKEAFEEEAADYFDGKNTYNQRLKYIFNSVADTHSQFSNEYALYVLIRGLFYFHKEDVDDSLWEKLTVNTGEKPGGHPWEIIYKYLEMLAIDRGDQAAREKFSKLKRESLTYRGVMIKALESYGDAEVADFAGDYGLRDELTEKLADYLKDNFEFFSAKEFSADGNKRYEELNQYFTFMYR